MEIDVVIDVVCPWCFVGKRQLDQAVAERSDVITEIRYRPFQLDPSTPLEGVDRKSHYKKKFGDSPQYKAAREHLQTLGEQLGIAFDFHREARIANTLDAHRLIRWAKSAEAEVPDAQELVVEGLMKAYFEEGQFLGDHSFLQNVAKSAGMDGALVGSLLASDQDRGMIQQDVHRAQQMGVSGVPFFIFDGKAGVSGAQDKDTLVQVIDRLSEQSTAS